MPAIKVTDDKGKGTDSAEGCFMKVGAKGNGKEGESDNPYWDGKHLRTSRSGYHSIARWGEHQTKWTRMLTHLQSEIGIHLIYPEILY